LIKSKPEIFQYGERPFSLIGRSKPILGLSYLFKTWCTHSLLDLLRGHILMYGVSKSILLMPG